MKLSGRLRFLSACLIVLSVSSCTPGKRPFLMVQLCLQNDSGVDQFKRELQDVARREGMRYIDGSSGTERDLKSLGVLDQPEGKFVHLGVESDGGPILRASNLSLNTYDVAVGFNGDHYSRADRAFADRVVARLRQHWELEIVPDGKGAFPNPQCIATSGTPPNNSFNPMPLRGTG